MTTAHSGGNPSMTPTHQPRWLEWAREIQALAQTGLTFTENRFEMERLRRLMEIAAEMVEAHTAQEREPLVEDFLSQPGYATPKIDVRGAVVRDDRILLVQERTDGRWCMPGGWADVGEYPSRAVAREVWEESGFEVVPCRVVGVYDANRGGVPLSFYHAYKIVYLCEILGGEANASDETAAVDFFSFEDLPTLSSFRTNEVHLVEVQAHLGDANRPTAFD
jgi:8-oxo-dGTP pyrophosphatase MutT (NUDIX family)